MSHQQPLPFRIDPMQPADIPEVIRIEHASYSMTWPSRAYHYELQQNDLAHYYVLRTVFAPSNRPVVEPSAIIIGLGGFWLMADEIHITTLAIHPHWRRLGLGEWLLLALLEKGQAQQASVATLEVRPSNHPARALYHKYNFREVGRRPRYYSDNGEDALILTTPWLLLPDYQAMLGQRKTALIQKLAKIDIDKIIQIN